MAYADRVANSTRLTTIAGVVVIHGLLGYAFVTGMATSFVENVGRVLTTTNIPLDPPPPPEPTPPLERTSPQPTQPTATSAATPIVPTPTDNVVPTLPLPPLPMPPVDFGTVTLVTPPPPPPLPVSQAVSVRASGNRGAWITTDDYPPSAIRAGEEGVVGISLQVGADGRAQSCTVTVPSGHAALDQATCRLYQRRARFTPARDDAGNAIPSTFADRIRWELPM